MKFIGHTIILIIIVYLFETMVVCPRPTRLQPEEFHPNPITLPFTATAYCKGYITAAGNAPIYGVVAADRTILPLGSVIHVSAGQHTGIYIVLDTGPAIRGNIIDIYMWSCYDALEFGRRHITVTVIRKGWTVESKLLQR